MVDWELIVPGMGLTILGIAGVGLSMAGIAKTFMEGMHAISALVMFIGIIILASGILKDGLPRSNQAKATVIIILGFLVTFGTLMMNMSTVPTLPLFAGVLLLILIPAIVIAYAAHRQSRHFRAVAILFTSASVVGGIAFVSFGFVAPKPVEAGVLEQPAAPPREAVPPPELTGPRFEIAILEGSAIEGNPAYGPSEAAVEKGTIVVWTNEDSAVHTVTSGTGFEDLDFASAFDSGTMNAGATWILDTSALEPGEYAYFCTFHPYMKGELTIVIMVEAGAAEVEGEGVVEVPEEAAAEKFTVQIVLGAANMDNPEFYSPTEITVTAGTTVTWINSDTAGHTVTSGKPGDADAGSVFDSGFPMLKTGEIFLLRFDTAGEYPYFCIVHPWMTGKVIVLPQA